MTANNCPSCYTPYDHCTCGPGGATKKGRPGDNDVSAQARAHFLAWRTLRQVTESVTIPAQHVEGRHIDTGRVNVQPYVKNETEKERNRLNYLARKAGR